MQLKYKNGTIENILLMPQTSDSRHMGFWHRMVQL